MGEKNYGCVQTGRNKQLVVNSLQQLNGTFVVGVHQEFLTFKDEFGLVYIVV